MRLSQNGEPDSAYRLSGPRATQEPEGGGWEPSARIRAFRSQLRARTRSTESPLDFPARRGPEPSGRSEMDQLGPKTGRVQPRRPPLWNFATACDIRGKSHPSPDQTAS